jgi:lipopolysaccharide transport system permease protein
MPPEVVYTPESLLRHPVQLFKLMWRDLLASRELAWRLMVRDISAQYRQSVLGFTWAFLPPIVMAAGFTLAGEANVINVGVTDLPYPAYVMFSTALWQTFVEAINGPVQAVTLAKPMLARVNFPREAIILAKVGEVFFNFAIKLILIAALFLWFRISVNWTVILAPVALIHLIMLGTLIGTLLSPLGVLYQDVSKGLTMLTGFWLFLTPVVYPVPTEGAFGRLVKLNPVTPLLVTTRELATTGVLSDAYGFWVVSMITIIGLLLAWIAFRLAMPYVIERVSS